MNDVRIRELLDYVLQGRFMDAMKEFYAEDVVREEPAHGEIVGLEANMEQVQEFVNSVARMTNFEAKKITAGDDYSIYENVMEWVDKDGNEMILEQVSVATWEDGKIVHERFYYDMG